MKRSWNVQVVFCFALELGFAAVGAAETVSIAARKNNTIYSESQFTNGGGQHFFAGTNQQNNYRRSIISFDVAGSVPAGSTVAGASLTLHMSRTHLTAAPVVVHLHRCLAPWGEGSVVGPSGEGGGGAPGLGDATWSFNAYDTSRWNAAGGDYAALSSGSALVSNDIGFFTWSSPGLVPDLQSWLDAAPTNFGWVLVAEGEGQRPVTAKRFDSRRNDVAEFRPVLQIVYTPAQSDGGVPDAGGDRDAGGIDAGTEDAGGVGRDAAMRDDPGDNRPTRGVPQAVGCQVAPGPFLALLAIAVLAVTRSRRACAGKQSAATK